MVDEPNTSVDSESATSTNSRFGGIRWKMLVVALVMGLLIGGLAAWGFGNISPGLAFIVALFGSTYFLYTRASPMVAFGNGLMITALVTAAVPLLFYIPGVFSDSGAEMLGSTLGLLIWGIVFFLIGIIVFVTGYFVSRWGKKRLRNRENAATADQI